MIEQWLFQYIKGFYSNDSDMQAHVLLKEQHTRRVRVIMAELVQSIGAGPEFGELADAAALLHDVGRYLQYQKYRTFNDFRSVDHAELAVEVIKEHNALEGWEREDAVKVRQAVRSHNNRHLPSDLTGDTLVLAQMIRDADKLDIFDMIVAEDDETRMISSPEYRTASVVSPRIVEVVLSGHTAYFEDMRTAADQMIFRMSWVYDLNFAYSFSRLHSKQILEKMTAMLPETQEIRRVFLHLADYRDQSRRTYARGANLR